MIDTNKIISTNAFSGFQNYTSVPFSTSIAGQNLGAGAFIGPIRATTPLNNTNAISQILIQYSGLDAFTRLLPGSIVVDYPNINSASYEIESFSYYSGGNLVVDTYISNQTGGTVVIPAITFNVTASLYVAPF